MSKYAWLWHLYTFPFPWIQIFYLAITPKSNETPIYCRTLYAKSVYFRVSCRLIREQVYLSDKLQIKHDFLVHYLQSGPPSKILISKYLSSSPYRLELYHTSYKAPLWSGCRSLIWVQTARRQSNLITSNPSSFLSYALLLTDHNPLKFINIKIKCQLKYFYWLAYDLLFYFGTIPKPRIIRRALFICSDTT